jgi:DNA-binding MarR family transcriptional regulator
MTDGYDVRMPSAPAIDPRRRPPSLLAVPGYVIHKVAQHGQRVLHEALAEHELALPHFAVLSALHDLGPVAQHALAAHLHIHASHLVRYLDETERRGLVGRERDPDDRRRQRVAITTAGEALIAKLTPAVERAEQDLLKALSPTERETLTTLLDRVLADHDRLEPEDRAVGC